MKVEICGGIASGKTTFCRHLVKYGYSTVLENFASNPFWECFYQAPDRYAFETELTFHLQHYHDIKKNIHCANIAYDFSLVLDLAYADINLAGEKHKIFTDIAKEVRKEVEFPQLVIYLRCPENVQMTRIESRRRIQEKNITIQYLSALNEALDKRIEELPCMVHVVRIDSVEVDFRKDIPADLLDFFKYNI